jgi:glycosyltransferase involved in cell wall biosynthesis
MALDAAPNIHPLGHVTAGEVRNELQHADIFLFPTRFESFGIAMAEALSCGTPVVASACSAIPEVVDDGITGVLCPVDDVEAFAAAVHSLAADPERLRRMSSAARSAAIARFDKNRMAAAYRNVFYSLAG